MKQIFFTCLPAGRFFILNFLFFIAVVGVSTNHCYAQSYVPEKNFSKMKIKPVIPVQAYAFNLKDVKLLNSPFTNAMSKDSAYLMLLKPDRLLYRFYKNP